MADAPPTDAPPVADGAPEAAPTERVITITDRAHGQIMALRAAEDDGESLGLRIEVTGVKGAEFAYDLAFEPLAECADDDHRYDDRGLEVVVPAASVDSLQGATLDIPTVDKQGGLVLRNPNRPRTPTLGEPMELTGTVEEKIRQLLDAQVNPAIAAHGGFATLDKVVGTVAHITMGGGCQGCAMSALTLREGIETAILENVDEITAVADATDHDSGENPFYT